MIIPVRCFTCGKTLADKWLYYERKSKELDDKHQNTSLTSEAIDAALKDIREDPRMKHFDANIKKDLLDELGLKRVCCRRHMLGHVDMMPYI